jgi:hypothetical protein
MNRTVEWLIVALAGIVGGGLGIFAAFVLMVFGSAIVPFGGAAIFGIFALPVFGAFGAILAGKIVGNLIDRRR